MSNNRDAPHPKTRKEKSKPTDADRLRDLLARAGLSQRAAARELGVDERTMRYWCSGDHTPPRMAFHALNPRIAHIEYLKRTILLNERQIEMLESG